MPKKKNQISQKEQSKRFVKAAKDMLIDGEQSHTEAGKRFERTVESIASSTTKPPMPGQVREEDP